MNVLERNCLVDEAGFEPAASAMPMQRSYQAGLLAHFFSWLLKSTVPHLISISYALSGSYHKKGNYPYVKLYLWLFSVLAAEPLS